MNQTRIPDEVVLVDDGSTDGTGDWIRSHYPQTQVLTTPNGGTSRARNRGAQEAHGDVLVFLDHDDTLLPHAVDTLVRLLAEFPEARAAFADHIYTNLATGIRYENHHSSQPSFHRLSSIPAIRQNGNARLYGRSMHRALLHGNLLQQPWAIHRQTFLELKGFEPDIRYCEDWDLYLRIAAAVPLVLSDEVISNHIIEGENLHLAQGQEAMHQRVILRQIRACFPARPREVITLCRRLANYRKCAGDLARQEQRIADAWKLNLQAALLWPRDHVVVGRLMLWAPRALWEMILQSAQRHRDHKGEFSK
jgi:glycosyltransferase involved in cell wall biosynthesis